MKKFVTDDHGNFWQQCAHTECDLHVVRPGKAQCDAETCLLHEQFAAMTTKHKLLTLVSSVCKMRPKTARNK